MNKLTESERTALAEIKEHGGSMLITNIPERNERGMFGETVPGMRVYQTLDRKGLVIITEEDPDEDGFRWTPTVELTEKGKAALLGAV